MDINLKIKQLLEKRKRTQDELAKAIGVSLKTISNYLNGITNIEANKIPDVARFLKVPVSYFFEDTDMQNLLIEPDSTYERKDCEICKSKDKTIAALEENIVLLKGQIEFLKKQA
jgi:transcriptional regulator with XRE-family HTH domain